MFKRVLVMTPPSLWAPFPSRGRYQLLKSLLGGMFMVLALWGGATGALATDFYYNALYQKTSVAMPWPVVSARTSAAADRLTHTFYLSDKLKTDACQWYGTYKLVLDSASGQDPTLVPEKKTSFTSRILEAGASVELGQGWFVDLGKKKLKTGVGYFKRPTDYLGLAATYGGARSNDAQEKLTEGLLGLEADYLSETYSQKIYYSPHLTWDADQSPWYKYLTSSQLSDQLLIQYASRLDMLDYALLAYHRVSGSEVAWNLGANANLVLGDRVELHGEASVQQTYTQLIVDGVGVQSRRLVWPAEFLLGSTYSFDPNTAWTGEYYFNGKGLAGSDYDRLLSNAPALAGVYGTLALGRHYLFNRFSRAYPNTKLTLEFLQALNLQDRSGFFSGGILYNTDNANFNLYGRNFFGASATEMGSNNLLWQLGCEAEIFL